MSPPSPSPSLLIHPNSVFTGPRSKSVRWDHTIPPSLRPVVRAYLLGYAFTVGPKLLSLIRCQALLQIRKRRRLRDGDPTQSKPRPPFFQSLTKTLRGGLELHRFATFCAAFVGGSTLLEPVLRKAFTRILKQISEASNIRLSRWFSSAIAAWFSIQLLQSSRGAPPRSKDTTKPGSAPSLGDSTKPQAGRTLDLTLFAATRALDVIIGEIWSQRRRHLPPSHSKTTKGLDRATSQLVDPLVFSLASGVIMWSWFYSPESLPRAYNKWIASAASVDERLVIALQRCRSRTLRYGEDTGQASLLQGMCKEYNWPLQWGDPLTSIPFPCELVHMGCGPSCEVHALARFARAWWWSLKMYLPLQLAMLLIRGMKGSKALKHGFSKAAISASRSSAFLGTFITLFYYGVCLARTRLGPHVLGSSTEARQRIDGGLCVGTGCFLCGWSVLLEPASRQKELALFVAPRAVATLLPRQYNADKLWIERMVFSTSMAVVTTCVLENEKRVRGVLGPMLRMVLAS